MCSEGGVHSAFGGAMPQGMEVTVGWEDTRSEVKEKELAEGRKRTPGHGGMRAVPPGCTRDVPGPGGGVRPQAREGKISAG